MGLLKKSMEYAIKEEQQEDGEIDRIIWQLLEIKKVLSSHIIGAHDGDAFVEAISGISDSIEKLEVIKETQCY